MTTTDTATQIHPCEGVNCHLDATEDVTASHLDPDDDGTGRMIGWSRPVSTRLCADCVADWECDDQTVILETHPL